MYGQVPSRARHLLVLLGPALALVALSVLVVMAVRTVVATGADTDRTSSTSSGQAQAQGISGDAIGAGEWETDPDTGLPIGASSLDGRPVGFPRSGDGAAAMVVELNRAQIGLDYDDAVTTVAIYAAEGDQEFFYDLASAAVAQRREDLGVPAEGTVDAPAGYAQTPIGYQVEVLGPDRFLVSVLNQVTATSINGQVERSAYIGQQLVTWNPHTVRSGQISAGDWELVEPTSNDRDQLLATPPPAAAELGTPGFEQAGWSALLEPAPAGNNDTP